MDAVRLEIERLATEHASHADAERRSLATTASLVLANVAFACTPLVPGAHHWFGALTAPVALLFVAPGNLLSWLSFWLYRRGGAATRAYRICDAIETVCLYAIQMSFVYASERAWSVIWILCPFSAVFFAQTNPFRVRFYVAVIVGEHALFALLAARGGNGAAASAALLVGIGSVLAHLVVARIGVRQIELEAERNLLQRRVAESALEDERVRISRLLRDGIGREIERLLGAIEPRLDAIPVGDGMSILDELERIVHPELFTGHLLFAELVAIISDKCRGLSDAVRIASRAPADAPPVDASVARALVRVAQELVRNAVTHGRAPTIGVDLAHDAEATRLLVCHDGARFSPEIFRAASGGIANAHTWLAEVGGTLEHASTAGGTELRATIPAGAPRPSGPPSGSASS